MNSSSSFLFVWYASSFWCFVSYLDGLVKTKHLLTNFVPMFYDISLSFLPCDNRLSLSFGCQLLNEWVFWVFDLLRCSIVFHALHQIKFMLVLVKILHLMQYFAWSIVFCYKWAFILPKHIDLDNIKGR